MNNLSSIDYIVIILMLLFIFAVFAKNWTLLNGKFLLTPISFIAAYYFYYIILAPVTNVILENAKYGHLDASPYLTLGWVGAFISFVSICFGYYCPLPTYFKFNNRSCEDKYFKIGCVIATLGIFMYLVQSQTGIKSLVIFESLSERNDGGNINSSIGNYFTTGLNVSLCAITLIFTQCFNKNKIFPKIVFCLFLVCCVALIVNAGFRYRFIFLLFSLSTIYYIIKKARPNVLFWAISGIVLLVIMGGIEVARNYGKGIDISKLHGFDGIELISSGANDTRTFFAGAAYMDYVYKSDNYTYFNPIYNALVRPLPSSIFPNKYIKNETNMMDIIFHDKSMGVAVPAYADHFLSFGWIGIIVFGIIFGWLSKCFFTQWRKNEEKKYNLFVMACYNGYTYIYLSRGYMAAQFESLLVYVIFPAIVIYYLTKNRKAKPLNLKSNDGLIVEIK